jgi:hypothetical protein
MQQHGIKQEAVVAAMQVTRTVECLLPPLPYHMEQLHLHPIERSPAVSLKLARWQ